MKKFVLAAGMAAILATTACNDADVASRNLSKAADNFEIGRRVVFYNGITGDYMLEIIGLCALGNSDGARKVTVTCKTEGGFKKHFLGLSDNVTFFAEQLDPAIASVNHYRVTFKPQTILPDFDLRGDLGEAVTPRPQD